MGYWPCLCVNGFVCTNEVYFVTGLALRHAVSRRSFFNEAPNQTPIVERRSLRRAAVPSCRQGDYSSRWLECGCSRGPFKILNTTRFSVSIFDSARSLASSVGSEAILLLYSAPGFPDQRFLSEPAPLQSFSALM